MSARQVQSVLMALEGTVLTSSFFYLFTQPFPLEGGRSLRITW